MLILRFKGLISMESTIRKQRKGRAKARIRLKPLAWGEGGEDTHYNGLYCKAPPKSGTVFRLQVYERVWISLVEVHDRVEKSLIFVCKKSRKRSGFLIDSQSIYSSLKGCKVVNYTPILQVCERSTICKPTVFERGTFFVKNGI